MSRSLNRCCRIYGFHTWLTVSVFYLVVIVCLNVRQIEHNQKFEVRIESNKLTTRVYDMPGHFRNDMQNPVTYKHLRKLSKAKGRNNTDLKQADLTSDKKELHQIENQKSKASIVSRTPKYQKPKDSVVHSNINAKNKQFKPPIKSGDAATSKGEDHGKADKKKGEMQSLSGGKGAKMVQDKDKGAKMVKDKDKGAKMVQEKDKGAKMVQEKDKGAKMVKDKDKGAKMVKDKDKGVKSEKNSVEEKAKVQDKSKSKNVPETKKEKPKPANQAVAKSSHQNTTRSPLPHKEGFIGAEGKIILLWTNLTTDRPLWNFKTWSLKKCPHKCQITNDRKYLDQASLVLFRLRMLRSILDKRLREFIVPYDVTDLPKKKNSGQVWVDVNQESPMYSHSDEELASVDSAFDYSVSYHSSSDFTYDYKMLYKKRPKVGKPINYAANKTRIALWHVSHCDSLSGRSEYVTELQKYNISVDVFGKCSGRKDGCNGYRDVSCVNKLKSKYKFYLAFENSICSEYITEKYWNILKSESYNIPIALGAKVDEYKSLSPPNSFVHVRNFTGAKELAKYLHTINNDDRMFNSYHSWREKYELYTEKKEPFDCWLCRMAYEQPASKRSSYSEFWSRRKLCEQNVEPIS